MQCTNISFHIDKCSLLSEHTKYHHVQAGLYMPYNWSMAKIHENLFTLSYAKYDKKGGRLFMQCSEYIKKNTRHVCWYNNEVLFSVQIKCMHILYLFFFIAFLSGLYFFYFILCPCLLWLFHHNSHISLYFS